MRAQDTFTRANQSGFGTASDGETWTANGPGTLSVASNEGVVVSVSSDTHVQLGSQTGSDVVVLCRLAVASVGDVAGVACRYATAGGVSCYKLLWYGGNIHINKEITGTITEMTSVAFAMTPGTFYWFKLRAVGSALAGKAWLSGTAEPSSFTTTTADNAITSIGGVAILANTATSTGIQFDTFSALSYVSSLRPMRRIGRMVPS
jgi:hypothetical protein